MITLPSAPARVAIVGGGYSGIAAATTLAKSGIACHVFEGARVLGGRARRVVYRDAALDNGQHILLGAYRNLLALMDEVGAPRNAIARYPLTLRIHPDFFLRAPRVPAPLNLLWALFAARGLLLADCLAAVRFTHALRRRGFSPAQKTVAELLDAHAQTESTVSALWEPLCLAALNTPLSRASAQTFATVLREALFRTRRDSDLLLPRIDLSALFPEPAERYITARGGKVETATRVEDVTLANGKFALATQHGSRIEFDAVICAVGPHQLDSLSLPVAVLSEPIRHEPIYTVYLRYDRRVTLPFVMTGRRRGLAQWFFDRDTLCSNPGLVAAVISASGPHQDLDHDTLAQNVHRELVQIAGPLAPPIWHKVVAEKYATFACEPDTVRPRAQTEIAGLFLAGDYTEGEYPATLEGAVQSGIRAARLVNRFLDSTLPAK